MGQVIAGRFELLDHIGSGASGAVWRAHDRRRHRECAAKVLRQKDSAELLRFVREQGVQLEHPHLATPYGWAAEDADVAIAMPLVRGGTLESALADHGAFSPELTATILLQILDGLHHVHEAGWLHRDVKPSNVLLEPTGTGRPHVRLADFGTALRDDEPRFTELGFVHGTPGYLPPETYQGAGPSREQDLYALGVVSIRMLHPTAKGDDALGRARQHLIDSDVPAPLKDTLLGLTDVDPDARVRAAEDAPGRLGAVAHAPGYRVASGELFEVFNQLPEISMGAGSTREFPLTAEPIDGPEALTMHTAASPAPFSSGMPSGPMTPASTQPWHDSPHTPRPARRAGSHAGPIVVMAVGVALIVAAIVVAWL